MKFGFFFNIEDVFVSERCKDFGYGRMGWNVVGFEIVKFVF